MSWSVCVFCNLSKSKKIGKFGFWKFWFLEIFTLFKKVWPIAPRKKSQPPPRGGKSDIFPLKKAILIFSRRPGASMSDDTESSTSDGRSYKECQFLAISSQMMAKLIISAIVSQSRQISPGKFSLCEKIPLRLFYVAVFCVVMVRQFSV